MNDVVAVLAGMAQLTVKKHRPEMAKTIVESIERYKALAATLHERLAQRHGPSATGEA